MSVYGSSQNIISERSYERPLTIGVSRVHADLNVIRIRFVNSQLSVFSEHRDTLGYGIGKIY